MDIVSVAVARGTMVKSDVTKGGGCKSRLGIRLKDQRIIKLFKLKHNKKEKLNLTNSELLNSDFSVSEQVKVLQPDQVFACSLLA